MDVQAMTEDLERVIRLSLRFDLGWSPDEARSLAAVLAQPVTARLEREYQ